KKIAVSQNYDAAANRFLTELIKADALFYEIYFIALFDLSRLCAFCRGFHLLRLIRRRRSRRLFPCVWWLSHTLPNENGRNSVVGRIPWFDETWLMGRSEIWLLRLSK
ncbi:hypothetical protein ACLN7E_004587, partial [Escherichia coli]